MTARRVISRIAFSLVFRPLYSGDLRFAVYSSTGQFGRNQARLTCVNVGRYLAGGEGMPRILLVEDDRDVRLLVEHVLMLERYEVDQAATIEAGRALLGRNHFDLVLTDAALPDGTGLELATQAERRGIPVIVMTAYAFRFGDELLRFEVLLKPVRPAELLKAVGRSVRLAPSG